MKRLILAILLICLLPFHASAFNPFLVLGGNVSAGIDTPTYVAYGENDNNFTAALTVAITSVAGTNRCFVAMFAWENQTQTVVSITYDGNAMTEIELYEGTNIKIGAWYYCTDTGTGSKDVVLTKSSTGPIAGWVFQVDGVNTADVVEDSTVNEVAGDSPQVISLAVTTTNTNTMILSGVAQPVVAAFSVYGSTGQTDLGDNGVDMGMAAGYYAFAKNGEKYQGWQSDQTYERQYEVVVSLNGL